MLPTSSSSISSPARGRGPHRPGIVALILALLGCLGAPGGANGQQRVDAPDVLPAPVFETPLRFQHLGIEDGLSQSSGDEFLQDRHGFLWIGTQGGGLNRFDGRSFKVFRPIPGDSTSLSNSFPSTLFEDSSGRLWVGTDDGINLYNPVDETFTRFSLRPTPSEPARVTGMDEDALGNLWILTSVGLVKWDAATGEFSNVNRDPRFRVDLLPVGGGAVVVDVDGFIWLAGATNLWRFDPESGELREYISSYETDDISEHFFMKIAVDSTDPDVLWIVGLGVYRLNRRDGSYRRFMRPVDGLDENGFISLAQQPGDPNTIWLAGFESGLFAFDVRDGSFTSYGHDPMNPDSPAANRLQDVYFDKSGLLWVGTGLNGVDRVDLDGGEFKHVRSIPGVAASLPSNEVRGISESLDGTVWVGNPPTGFVSYDQATSQLTRYESVESRLPGPVWNIEPSADGSIWLGTLAGGSGEPAVFNYDPSTATLTEYPETITADFPNVGAFLEDDDGILWIGHFEGVDRLDPVSRVLTTDVIGRRGVDVADIAQDNRGRLWIATRNAGLAVFEPESGNTTWYEPNPRNPSALPAPWVTNVVQVRDDPDGYWVSTYGGGLARLDERTGRFKVYTTVDGLADNVVYGILEDDDGRLWMSTNRGLSRFDPETETFQTFGTERGIQSWEFNQHAFHRSPTTGLMYFGGINGFNVFDPDALTPSDAPPQVAFTSFLIHNRVVDPGPDSPLKTAINLADHVVLAPDQNGFGFEFAAMDFKIPGQNRYRYMLEGFDGDWIDGGHDGKASYTNLRSGQYTFRVHGTNSNGRWSDEPATIAVTILPPWWRTWWAYAGYVLLFAAGVFTIDRVQRGRLIRREREKTRARELEQAREIEKAYHELRETKDRLVQQEKLASLGSLTAGIAHEMKNPLNFVNNFAELNEELVDEVEEALQTGNVDEAKEVLSDLKANTSAIAEHGRRADSIVKGMMAHASGGHRQRDNVAINDLVSEYADLAFHGKRAQSPAFKVEVEKKLNPDAGVVRVIAPDVGRVILNLVGNAFDALEERATADDGSFVPTVTVSTERDGRHVRILVADNGTGIDKDKVDKLFEPFFTTKPAGKGTGLGLSLSHEIIVTGHGGALRVESERGVGTTFIVELPIDA